MPPIAQSGETLYALEEIVGAKRICWRYDSMLLTRDYAIERHFEMFDWLAARLAGHVDRCTFSFVEIYRKLEHNMPELSMMSVEQMDELARGFNCAAVCRAVWLPDVISTAVSKGDAFWLKGLAACVIPRARQAAESSPSRRRW